MSEHHDPHAEHAHGAHEKTDANAGAIIKFTIGLIVFLVLTDVGLRWCSKVLEKDDTVVQEPLTGDPNAPIAPPPRLQRASAIEINQLNADETERLTTYGWVDRDAKIVRMPIEEAKKIIAKDGLPKWPKAASSEVRP
jgi:hypothetical protein